MFRLFVTILILPCLKVTALYCSEINLINLIEKLDGLEKKIDAKMATFADQLAVVENKMAEFEANGVSKKILEITSKLTNSDNQISILNDERSDADKHIHKINDAIAEIKDDVETLKQAREEKNVTKNDTTDLEERVSELENDMDKLQETENIQNENIVLLRVEVDQLEDATNGE